MLKDGSGRKVLLEAAGVLSREVPVLRRFHLHEVAYLEVVLEEAERPGKSRTNQNSKPVHWPPLAILLDLRTANGEVPQNWMVYKRKSYQNR